LYFANHEKSRSWEVLFYADEKAGNEGLIKLYKKKKNEKLFKISKNFYYKNYFEEKRYRIKIYYKN